MRSSTIFRTLAAGAVVVVAHVAPLAADENRLREVISDRNAELSDLWIYNDLASAFAEARRSGRPLFVTFRCVPCKDCKSFDAEVAAGKQAIDALARQKFVAVRQVEMKGVDLSMFQFDHDLNWAAMFLNADGTVYARYGTQSIDGPDAFNSIAGLERTMRRVLELHAAYPKNQAELAGKQGAKKPYRTALEMPGLENRDKLAGPTTRENCIHCHNVHDAENQALQEAKTPFADFLWRYPLPADIGLDIDPLDGRTVRRVLPQSAAERAGVRAGEEITHVGGEAIASIADVQWALHHTANTAGKLRVRGSLAGERELALETGWKRTDPSWRGSIWSIAPRMRVWAPEVEAARRRELAIAEDRLALLVKWINVGASGGRAARDSGLREGDVIVALDGDRGRRTPQRFQLDVKLGYRVGGELPLTVIREGTEKNLRIRLAE